jgi:hypothetical protein
MYGSYSSDLNPQGACAGSRAGRAPRRPFGGEALVGHMMEEQPSPCPKTTKLKASAEPLSTKQSRHCHTLPSVQVTSQTASSRRWKLCRHSTAMITHERPSCWGT